MKRSNAVRGIFWLAIVFTIAFLVRAESGDRRTEYAAHKEHACAADPHIGSKRPASRERHAIGYGTIVDVAVGPVSAFTFDPDTVNISVGDTVRWTWGSSGHSVTSGPPCAGRFAILFS